MSELEMKVRPLLLSLMLGAGLCVVVPAAEQSLAEVARNAEAARNASAERPRARVYTNKDLAAVDRVVPVPAASNATAPAPKPAPPAPSGDVPRPDVKGEAYWRDRMRPLRERLDRARAVADDTKRQADALMRSADRCFQIGVVCADYTESLRLAEAHKALVQDVASAEREVAALEEEARRAGVPPGWLRE
jgi:type IV secretory pathway VirB10-like protein